MDFKQMFKGIFKRGRKKKPGHSTQASSSSTDIPSPESSILGNSPPPGPSMGVSALIVRPLTPLPVSSTFGPSQTESTVNDAWTNLAAFVNLLHQAPGLTPIAAVIDNLSWFIRAHETFVLSQRDYQNLRGQLEALFKDLLSHFSSGTPPAMTTSILNLCGAIGTELQQVYGTRDRDMISRLMQVEHDTDKITGCYRRIQGHLERVVEAQLNRLNPSMPARYNSADAHVVHRRECTANTRKQVLLDLTAWKDKPDGEKVCWMNGMAGTGKTTITNTLCSLLDQSYELGASFFCTRSLPACRDVKLILPTIAYQLARFSDPFRGALSRVLKSDPDVHTKVLRVQFQRMILEPLQAVKGSLPTKLVVVIDALDECDDGSGVEQILDVLLENSSGLPVKFLVSSRPEYHIRDKIGKLNLRTQLTLHELDESVVKTDIETYLRAELARMSISVTNEQLESLVERAGVLFIYAATAIRYLTDGDPLERLDTVLQISEPEEASGQNQDIDGLYDAVLVSALGSPRLERSERRRIELVLHSVICAREPLSIEALAGLLGLSTTKVAAALKPLWSVLHVSGRNTTDRVNILHASFPEYLLDPKRSGQFACEVETHNAKLVGLCFRRISHNVPQFNICRLESSYVFDQEAPNIDERRKQLIPMDLVYACLYWAVHLDLSGTPDGFGTELDDFFSKRLLLWMEVLNLTERIERGIGLLEKAKSWLRVTGRFETTALLAQDARRFVTMFATSSVSRSTPHIYVSMLSSWPDHQPIAQHYMRRALDPVSIKGINSVKRQLGLLSSIPTRADLYAIAYSSNGRFFATGTSDGTIQIWDAASCRMTIDPIDAHTSLIQAIAISPDGNHVCSGSYDYTVCVWDTQNGQRVAGPHRRHTNWVSSVSFSPDGQWFASGSHDGTVCLWGTQDQELHGDPLEGRDGHVWCVAFSPNNSIVAAGSDSLVHLWDISTGQKIHPPLQGHTSEINGVAFLPDGNRLVSVSSDRTMRVWNVSTRKTEFGPFQEHQSEVTDIACSADGSFLASASVDSTIRLWDTQIWQVCSVVECPAVIRSMTFAPDNSRLLAACDDRCIRVWDVQDLLEYRVVGNQHDGHSDWIRSVAFLPCGTQFISGSDDTTVCLWDVHSGKLLRSLSYGQDGRVCSVGTSINGDLIYAILFNYMICVWETQTGQLVDTIGPFKLDGNYSLEYQQNWPADLILDERRVVCGSHSGRIYMWKGNELCFEVTGHNRSVYAIAFSPNGHSFVSGSNTGEIMLWNAATGEKLLRLLTGHSGEINTITFSLDGSLFASGSGDGIIRLWSPTTGLMVGDPLQGHTSFVKSVVFSRDGHQLVSGSQDMTAWIWDVASGTSRAVLRWHTDQVLSVALSPDATQIVTGSADMTIRLSNTSALEGTFLPCSVSSEGLPGSSASIKNGSRTQEWEVDEDGWVCNRQRQLLFWVPPDLRGVLMRPQNSKLISRRGCIELDFSNARIGDAWANCYQPFPPASTQ